VFDSLKIATRVARMPLSFVRKPLSRRVTSSSESTVEWNVTAVGASGQVSSSVFLLAWIVAVP
jgi:hypothetical protein